MFYLLSTIKILATEGKKVKHLFFTEHRAHANMHSPKSSQAFKMQMHMRVLVFSSLNV